MEPDDRSSDEPPSTRKRGPDFDFIDHESGTGPEFVPPTRTDGEKDSPDSREIPGQIDRYEIERLLGRGGFGSVYLAIDPQLDRRVAIKVAHRESIASMGDARIYLSEARNVARLDHPHIAPVYDVGSTEEVPFYFVSKYIEGENLAQTLREERLNHFVVARIVSVVAEALQHAHRNGLVHRDVKPANILIDRSGQPHLVDFGLALSEQSIESETRYVGTPVYTSPEQARGEGHRVDGRSDVFSLGVVLYEMLTGRRPFRGSDRKTILQQVASYEPRPPRQYDESIPRPLDRICQKAMAKLARDRYDSAHDMAEELELFLRETENRTGFSAGVKSDGGHTQPLTARNTSGSTKSTGVVQEPDKVELDSAKDTERPSTSISSLATIDVVPKGIRSFDAHDSEFFLQLVPGARDRHGVPESIRFWQTRLEEMRREKAFSIGLLYGPSGCGKSSLVQAGLLPRLSNSVEVIYLQASSENTEERLKSLLHAKFPTLPRDRSLTDLVKMIRNGYGPAPDKKVLLVLDQFEQWLHLFSDRHDGELVKTLRQCDGGRIQTLLLVRDDFWMAATSLMREVEERISEGHNAAAVDLLPTKHAVNVLAAFGRAFGALPENAGQLDSHQSAFLNRVVEDLSQDGKVICVRLALFAEIMKSRPWTLQSLQEVGGAQGIGVKFLESVFGGPSAPLSYRYHERAARMALRELLPPTGQSIRGHTRTAKELCAAAGYRLGTDDFKELMAILDTEVRLITPVDEANSQSDEALNAAERRGDADQNSEQRYQLTHDYLVQSLEAWLTQKQRQTRRGRAELLLAERTDLWAVKSENRYLPTLGESVRIRWWTDAKRWKPAEKQMMRRARRVHGLRLLGAFSLAAVLLLGSFFIRRYYAQKQMVWKADSLVDELLRVKVEDVPEVAREIDQVRDLAERSINDRWDNVDSRSRWRYEFVSSDQDEESERYLIDYLPQALLGEFPIIRDRLAGSDRAAEVLSIAAADQSRPNLERFQAACAVATYAPDSQELDSLRGFVLQTLLTDDTVVPAFELMNRIEHLRAWQNSLEPALMATLSDESSEPMARQRAATAIAAFFADQPDELLEAVLLCRRRTEFAPLVSQIENRPDRRLTSLREIVAQERPGESTTPEEYDEVHHRIAIAAALLAKFGESDAFFALFEKPEREGAWDPSLWSLAKHYACELVIPGGALIAKLDDSNTGPELTTELIEILGRCGSRGLSPSEFEELLARLRRLSSEHLDSGVHHMSRWALSVQGTEPEIQPANLSVIEMPQLDSRFEQLPEYRKLRDSLVLLRRAAEERLEERKQEMIKLPDLEHVLADDSLIAHLLFRDQDNHVLVAERSSLPSLREQVEQAEMNAGLIESALNFSGGNPISLGTEFQPERDQPFSYGCWVRALETESWGGIISRFDAGNQELSQHRGFDLWSNGVGYAAHLSHSEPNSYIKVTMASECQMDQWHHVFVTYDGSSKAAGLKLYFDGEISRTKSDAEEELTETISTEVPVLIGSRSGNFPYRGWVDDVRIYERELSADEVQGLFRAAIGAILRQDDTDRSSSQQQFLARALRSEDQVAIESVESQLIAIRDRAERDDWDKTPRWFVNEQNQQFVALPSVYGKSVEGSIPYDFAIGVHPVTVAQFASSGLKQGFDLETVESLQSPVEEVSWFEIARYCNWLSKKENIPEREWAYEAIKEGEYAGEMRLRADYARLRGYRLPTVEEWEYAGRCHANSRFFFGGPSDLLNQYGWFAGNSLGLARDVKTRIPNGFGLFDVHGNVWEFPLELFNLGPDGVVNRGSHAKLRGGAMNSGISYVSFEAVTGNVDPTYRSHTYGFRLAKSLPRGAKTVRDAVD